MTSSYLVCDVCGQYGPPAGFFFKDGVRMCYQCFFEETRPPEHDDQQSASEHIPFQPRGKPTRHE